MKKLLAFVYLHFRWMLFVLSILLFLFFNGWFQGAASVGFFWSAIECYKFYLKKLKA